MPRQYLLLTICSILCFLACKKKEDTPAGTPATTASDYLPLKPGNYWIYESYVVNDSGVGSAGTYSGNQPLTDSFYVKTDTVIHGLTYHRLMKPEEPGSTDYYTYTLRDSGGNLVDTNGTIVLTVSDTSVLLFHSYNQPAFSNDSFATVTWRKGPDKTMSVPAGLFPTTSMVYEWTFYPYKDSASTVNRRHLYYRYAKGVGIVSETLPFYIQEPRYLERRLVAYHVQ